jgi:hypothetical protein
MDRVTAPRNGGQHAGDPIIDEVRERRQRVLKEHGNDLEQLCRAIEALEREHPEKVRPKGASASRR